MNFLNIEKNKIHFFFKYFMFSSRFMLFPTLQKKFGVQKKIRGGWGGVLIFFKILSHFTFYAIFKTLMGGDFSK